MTDVKIFKLRNNYFAWLYLGSSNYEEWFQKDVNRKSFSQRVYEYYHKVEKKYVNLYEQLCKIDNNASATFTNIEKYCALIRTNECNISDLTEIYEIMQLYEVKIDIFEEEFANIASQIDALP
jgi:hypothetical protein